MDDVAWWAEGKSEKKVARTLSNAAEATLDWAENGVAYDKAKAEVMFLSKRRKNHTESVRVTMKSSATNTLGIWIVSKMTLKEHHSTRAKNARTTMHCIRLTGQLGVCPDACRRTLMACVQALALYGVELWWDDREGSGVGNRRDELQKL